MSLRPLYMSPASPAKDLARGLLRENLVGGPSGVLVRADLLRALGGFDPALSGTEDWDLWMRLGVGQLARAVLALGGAGIWQRVRARVVGPRMRRPGTPSSRRSRVPPVG